MPIKKSAKKALKQSKKRHALNLKRKETVHDLLKETRGFIEAQKKEEALKLLPKVYKALDKAAKTGVIKRNTAARKKSRLTSAVNGLSKEKVAAK